MASEDLGSLTKEPPLATLDETIRAITPSMGYSALLAYAREHTHKDAPGLIRQRFLLVQKDGTITYDYFLSLVANNSLDSPFIRKIMYFLWAYRDHRLRDFICKKIVNRTGAWRVSELTNKRNATFFEQWLAKSTAKKARSNIEYFLVETKIFNPKTGKINLNLHDNWLQHAAVAASQHERDISAREELLANPIEFLRSRGWIGLLNASAELRATLPPILATDSSPVEDSQIQTEAPGKLSGSEWRERELATSGRGKTTAEIDLVARERANKSHYSLEKLLASAAKREGFKPKQSRNIDMYFDTPTGSVLVEIKSCTDGNFHSQLRKGVSQLFEYRFLFSRWMKPQITMLLVMETVPPARKSWLVDYLSSLGVILAWRGTEERSLVSTCELPASLSGFVASIRR